MTWLDFVWTVLNKPTVLGAQKEPVHRRGTGGAAREGLLTERQQTVLPLPPPGCSFPRASARRHGTISQTGQGR